MEVFALEKETFLPEKAKLVTNGVADMGRAGIVVQSSTDSGAKVASIAYDDRSKRNENAYGPVMHVQEAKKAKSGDFLSDAPDWREAEKSTLNARKVPPELDT
ncbi:hypothetical protein Tco_1302793 [Tanacetum coccineum]